MSIRAVINVATTPQYIRGQKRLYHSIRENSPGVGFDVRRWTQEPHTGCPPHEKVPYAFKAYALEQSRKAGGETLLWCDSSIVCLRNLTPLFERIERDGYWIANNGWLNSQWTADSAYPDLFSPADLLPAYGLVGSIHSNLVALNRTIPHVVATCFGLSMRTDIGRTILAEYFRLASETQAFVGPWWNSNGEREDYRKHPGAAPCGPPECLGHRHDQTALSVIARRLGCQLTNCPEIFAYWEGRDESTILAAKGIE
jgi:hypothetical protein